MNPTSSQYPTKYGQIRLGSAVGEKAELWEFGGSEHAKVKAVHVRHDGRSMIPPIHEPLNADKPRGGSRSPNAIAIGITALGIQPDWVMQL